MENIPLISVVVLTYNSSLYITETLNSIKDQTYDNIELIITDDCSTDSTLIICEDWINLNKSRFCNTEIIKTEENTGIAPNFNRGFKKAKGVWIKVIAGDDLLMTDCIRDNLTYVQVHSTCGIVFSAISAFKTINNKIQTLDIKNHFKRIAHLSAEEQLKILLKENIVPAPSSFIKSDVIKSVDYADENYPFMEDYPLWIRFLTQGVHLDYFDTVTVKYRMEESLTRESAKIVNEKYFDSFKRYHEDVLFKLYPLKLFLYKYHLRLYLFRIQCGIKWFSNKPTQGYIRLRQLLKVIDPYWYFLLINDFDSNKHEDK